MAAILSIHSHPRGLAPEAFKAVELADVAVKNMDNNAAIIQENPLPTLHSLTMPQRYFLLFHHIHNILCDRADMRAGISVGDHKIVGNAGMFCDV